MTMYFRDYKTMGYGDTEYLIKKTDENPNCWDGSQVCQKNFYVTYGKQYFYLANWSRTESATANFTVLDLGAKHIKTALVVALISILTFAL